jgi:hypothetical protein
MRRFILLFLLSSFLFIYSNAQRRCAAADYQKQSGGSVYKLRAENFIRQHLNTYSDNERPAEGTIIIPVVIHLVYHLPEENIPDETIRKQLEALNRDYRRNNVDTINTPDAFKSLAADCNIEFELAKVDPLGRATTGIERTYSPIPTWYMDDKVKASKSYGADAWDSRYYLNFWICNLDDLLGYSSVPGDDPEKDGVVLSLLAVNNLNDGGSYSMGRTAVHETGHWLGLYHLWGDADCGDDQIPDTPKQTTYTPGCPGGIRVSCNNSTAGDMYMNFMDFTDDPCTNLFTRGQKQRMRVSFEENGPRNTILSSKALGRPWIENIPLPDDAPQWLYPQLYPNPANEFVQIDFRYDARWIGRAIIIVNTSGQVVHTQVISSKLEKIFIDKLRPGIYFVSGKKDGEKLSKKFIKVP